MSTVAKRYASALMDVARESGSLDPVGKDLQDLEALLSSSDEFKTFVAHQLLTPEEQQACMDKIFGKAAFPLTQNLFKLLIARERLNLLPELVRIGLELWQEENGILPVSVLSAAPLAAAQEKALIEKLSQRTGKQIVLNSSVDESLIGGFRLHIGDQVEDHSLAAKLETFKRNVINA
ncbi:ATP synthase F1 subunit delta [Kiritimatiellaeota bacterium B1221]|nr:ATP synthase F1 subunit delta [Kiritimatiellaeota bacterium B1221]